MRNYLIPENTVFFKANLHCHTTVSDGKKTPEQVKEDYKAHGYSVVAFTDHDKYVPHNELSDESFIALNGFELEYFEEGCVWHGITTHLCFIADDPNTKALGYSNPDFDTFMPVLAEGDHPVKKGGGLYNVLPPYRSFTPSYINADIKAAKKMGFFVTYNHPNWSFESYPRYSEFKDLDAMEICNFGCVNDGYDEDDGRVYSDMVSLSPSSEYPLGCIATDDNHNFHPDGDTFSDSYGGWVNIAAPSLEYKEIVKALRNRAYYSCACVNPSERTAPKIKALWAEDGIIHVETSPVQNILFIKNTRPCRRVSAGAEGLVSSADFKPGSSTWFRIVAIDKNGNKAFTNAYFSENVFR